MVEKFITEAYVYARAHSGYTALTYAALKGNIGAAEALLEHVKKTKEEAKNNAEINKIYYDFLNAKHFFGKNALMIAAEKGYIRMIKMLVEADADIAIKRWLFGKNAYQFEASDDTPIKKWLFGKYESAEENSKIKETTKLVAEYHDN